MNNIMPNYNYYTPIQTGSDFQNQRFNGQNYYSTPADNSNTIKWVQGEAGAKAYPVAAGNSVMLMDSENPVLYIKSTDFTGKPLPIEIYDLVKREKTEQKSSEIKYVTEDQLNNVIAELSNKFVMKHEKREKANG